jgi:Tfp pilus assembly protein PilZ
MGQYTIATNVITILDNSTDHFRISRVITEMNQDRNKGNDQRRHPRQASFIIVEYTVKEGKFRDIMKNVGAGGMFINTQRSIAVDQPILLEFPLFDFDHTIQASGRVARRSNSGFAVSFDQPIAGLICKEGHLPEIVHEIDRIENN